MWKEEGIYTIIILDTRTFICLSIHLYVKLRGPMAKITVFLKCLNILKKEKERRIFKLISDFFLFLSFVFKKSKPSLYIFEFFLLSTGVRQRPE